MNRVLRMAARVGWRVYRRELVGLALRAGAAAGGAVAGWALYDRNERSRLAESGVAARFAAEAAAVAGGAAVGWELSDRRTLRGIAIIGATAGFAAVGWVLYSRQPGCAVGRPPAEPPCHGDTNPRDNEAVEALP